MSAARILIIAGSDSGGGAGIQADIKTVTMLGGHAMTAVTAITAQNTVGVQAVHPVPADMVIQQCQSVVSDIGVDAVKIGMIGSAETAEAVAEYLKQLTVPIVFDPVMVATSGATLADARTISVFQKLMALASVVTPNVPEMNALGGAAPILRHGCHLLMKGGHADGQGDEIVDQLLSPNGQMREWRNARINSGSTHGTGCTLASAVACGLGQGMNAEQAVDRGIEFVRLAIYEAAGLGKGHGPMAHQNVRADAMVPGASLNQITLPARDYRASVLFYQDLGLRQIVDSPDNGYARFEAANGVTLSVHQSDADSGGVVVYLESRTLDQWVTQLSSDGFDFDQMPRDEDWGWREARLRDPHGNIICLYQAGENRRYPPWRLPEQK
ncbi:bifunctional hydroxymethylpyrimidine kinase/phosphomethylpyrimidine kinase [Sphingorhabdus arenilitoris]|uniref:hydroxymethylpyrimidine kinase n=1 Tax=Sphingorhabdus arenilitoris TaxID=1490041 RepID=A0ABV8RH30_9SPHN